MLEQRWLLLRAYPTNEFAGPEFVAVYQPEELLLPVWMRALEQEEELRRTLSRRCRIAVQFPEAVWFKWFEKGEEILILAEQEPVMVSGQFPIPAESTGDPCVVEGVSSVILSGLGMRFSWTSGSDWDEKPDANIGHMAFSDSLLWKDFQKLSKIADYEEDTLNCLSEA